MMATILKNILTKSLYNRVCLFLFFFCLMIGLNHHGHADPFRLQVKDREITVNGKKSQVFEVIQANGTRGLFLQKGTIFDVIVENQIKEPTGIHWHGLILPNDQDGVPYVTQSPIQPGEKYHYHFPLIQAGTFWMHAHYGLQEQKLLTAPLILRDPKDQSANKQEVVLFFSDFSFRSPQEIFKELKNGKMKMSHEHHSDKTMEMSSLNEVENGLNSDLNDVKYDAFLTNWRTLSDPDVITVEPEKEIRLRCINGSSSSNFFIQLGNLKGELIATDGSETFSIFDTQFELGIAQRLDILIKIPKEPGVFPILAQGEGLAMRTGLILATPGMNIQPIKENADNAMKGFTYRQELLFRAKNPLPKKEVNRRLIVNLDGDMAKYVWTINGKAWPDNDPLMVKEGERVELVLINRTSMSHPMHLHGHVFQITEIDGQPLNGPMRDTVVVLPKSTVKVQFDALNPGNWPFHCHNLYHQYAGMMTTLNYFGFKGPIYSKSERAHE